MAKLITWETAVSTMGELKSPPANNASSGPVLVGKYCGLMFVFEFEIFFCGLKVVEVEDVEVEEEEEEVLGASPEWPR